MSSLILEPILLNSMIFYFVKLRDPNEKWKIHGDFTALNKEKLISKKVLSVIFQPDVSQVWMKEP